MAVTYADLVAFGFAYVENNYQGPKLQLRNRSSLLRPEDACPCSEEDFIMLAEFSEIKGPISLVTVPSRAQQQGTIDINSFIMRIMSVDYQANPWGNFCICQDTQVLQTYISHDRHAYVHYFTLYDLHARGFVRPMCIAYVSADQQKLHRLFPKMRKYFLEITEVMKMENRNKFHSEISSALHVIEMYFATQQEDEENNSPSSSQCNGKGNKNEQLLHQYTDFKSMQQVVKASLIDSENVKTTLDLWCNAFTVRDGTVPRSVELYLKLLSIWNSSTSAIFKINDGGCTSEKHLRPMPALCPWGTAFAVWRLFRAVALFRHCELSTPVGNFPTLSSSQDVSCLMDGGTSDSVWEALAQAEFLQLMEAVASGALEAATLSAEEQDDAHVYVKEGASGNEGSCSYYSLSDSAGEFCINGPVKHEIQGHNMHMECNNSIEPLDICDQRELHHHESDSVAKNKTHRRQHCLDSNHCDLSASTASPRTEIQHKSHCIPMNVTESNSLDEQCETDSNDSDSFHDILEVLHGDDSWSVGSSDCELSVGAPWNHCLWTQYRPISKPGHRLLKFFWTFRSAAQHVIYSVLMGRTLVLAGDAKSELRVSRIMNALTPLIPPLDRNGLRVLRWHQGILVSAHIARYQVIGMCIPERLSIHDMISPRDKNSVSILDVNREQLLGPAYRGQLLAAIGSNICEFPSDHSVLLFIQSVLSGIGYKLQAYKALVSARSSELPSRACRLLDLHGCDADMIRFLSKLPP